MLICPPGPKEELDSTVLIAACVAGALLLCFVVLLTLVMVQRRRRKQRDRGLFMVPDARLLEEDSNWKNGQVSVVAFPFTLILSPISLKPANELLQCCAVLTFHHFQTYKEIQ